MAISFVLTASSIQDLNVNFMAKTKSCYKFFFDKFHKSWRQSKSPPAVTYQGCTQNEILCVVRTLDEYIVRVESWRSGEEHFHTPVIFSKISRWLKTIIMKSGIDTSDFKGHSTSSASTTSKADLQEASIEDILKRGSWSNKTTWQIAYNTNIVEEG